LLKNSFDVALVAEKKAGEPHLPVIHQVDVELDKIVAIARSTGVRKCHRVSGNTTIAGTCEVMQDASIVHIACHGKQDPENALRSGFCLGDGRLTISNLMELKLDNPYLAFLSACETAQGDKAQPDQVMHLAAGMMFAGFKTVIATMWYVPSVLADYD
jgi:CHAT domain-containing protein